jgi:hypothetical protein
LSARVVALSERGAAPIKSRTYGTELREADSMKEDIWTDFDAEPLVLLRAAGDIIEDVLNLIVGWYYYDSRYTLNGSTQMDVCVFLPGCPSGAPGVARSTSSRSGGSLFTK